MFLYFCTLYHLFLLRYFRSLSKQAVYKCAKNSSYVNKRIMLFVIKLSLQCICQNDARTFFFFISCHAVPPVKSLNLLRC